MTVFVQPFSLTTGKRSRPLNWSTVQLVPAYNSAGSWTFTAAATPDVQALAQFNADGSLKPFGLLADWNGIYRMAGVAESCTVTQTTDDSGREVRALTFSGADGLVLLANRLAYVRPIGAWSAQTGTSKTYGPAAAETVIKDLIADNCVSAGDSNRNYALLDVATDLARGDTVSWKVQAPSASDDSIVATLADSLMDIWRALAAAFTVQLGLQVSLQGTRLVADVYEPRDLSRHAVFSARLGNLSSAELDVTNPSASAILQQSGVTGSTWPETDGAGGTDPWRRVEAFDDQSAATTAGDVTAAARDAVTAGKQQTQLQSTALDLPRLRFGADDASAGITGYRLGDLVAVDLLDGLTYTDRISSVTLSADATGDAYAESVVPSVGTATDGTTITAALQRQITALEKRIRRARNG